jgi:hypothetical protein
MTNDRQSDIARAGEAGGLPFAMLATGGYFFFASASSCLVRVLMSTQVFSVFFVVFPQSIVSPVLDVFARSPQVSVFVSL